MEGFVVGVIVVSCLVGFFLKAIGKHDEFKDATKKAGLSLLERFLKR